ncbi:uncharacterized protein MYCGRDRAFT_107050 [Zymoseptoria tritici IPO323]|uniref:Beta-glucuronidase C-terminal domain-containing protein n=1 Tax=Zymoseptoria tritici (strain CBS 115943 / IPO323) TaxID=336722 RepID=F9WZ34_ZYMTI|nr:uncharacterized protein MYCGRDRAFT_107050 [Zymoseptoria tritici IPO323]EGP91122.1 hypothetical protein MYCGRDRAFT_107050 [Zymoseptoria tritici IPO323]
MMWSSLLLLPLAVPLALSTPLLETRQSLLVHVPFNTPNGASDVVPHNYAALAMSQHSFHEYAGNKASPNIFSRNLINSISSRQGAPVAIRVGGTSGDFSVFLPNQREALTLPPGAEPGGIPRGMRIGTAWFEGFSVLPNVRWTYMAHLANDSNGQLANSVAAVREALKNIPWGTLDALEIGNEVNFYPNVNRPGSYSPSSYLSDFHRYRTAIDNAVGPQPYQAPVLYENNCPWCLANIFNLGQGRDPPIKSAAPHHYMDGGPQPMSRQAAYMNHTRIARKLDAFKAPIAWLKANRPNIPLHLAEVNSNTYSQGNEEKIGVFGSALWLVDYMLYGATLGIKRMNVQQSTGFAYTSWRAVEYFGKPAAVLPPYYAHPFVADVIGNSGNVRIHDLKLGLDLLSAYAVYDTSSNTVSKIVLINLHDWSPSSSSSSRPSRSVSFKLGGSSYGSTVRIEKLTAPGADVQDASRISWKGQSWTRASNGLPVSGTSTTQATRANNGRFAVNIRASEALLLTLT